MIIHMPGYFYEESNASLNVSQWQCVRNWDLQNTGKWCDVKQGMDTQANIMKFSAWPALYAGVIFLESRGDRV